jgi:hypothetical protein
LLFNFFGHVASPPVAVIGSQATIIPSSLTLCFIHEKADTDKLDCIFVTYMKKAFILEI